MLKEAGLLEYVFCFFLLNFCYLIAIGTSKRKTPLVLPWLLILIYCVYGGCWDPDYYSLEESFNADMKEGKDIIYPFLSMISFGSYSIFRFYIWGLATYLFSVACSKFKLKPNISSFVLIFFFLLSFSYARASLGMAFYFCGLSIIMNNKKRIPAFFLWGLLLILLSFTAHRSMAILIALTPLAFFKMTKKRLIALCVMAIVIGTGVSIIFAQLSEGEMLLADNALFESFNKSAYVYSKLGEDTERNWKFILTRILSYSAYYVGILSLIAIFVKKIDLVSSKILGLMTISIVLVLIGSSLMAQGTLGANVAGYRILYMTGIPIVIMLTYAYQNGFIKRKKLFWVFLPSILYSESFIFGKILSLLSK